MPSAAVKASPAPTVSLTTTGSAGIIGPLAIGIEQAALRTASQAYQTLSVPPRQLFDLPAHSPAQAQHFRQDGQFGIVELHDVGQAQ